MISVWQQAGHVLAHSLEQASGTLRPKKQKSGGAVREKKKKKKKKKRKGDCLIEMVEEVLST